MRDKYLPIGTVVLLKGGTKRVMITGFCSVAQEELDKIYDYSGCVYPEGYLKSDQVCLFDHEQIEKICFVGFEDEEEKTFKDKLLSIVSSLNSDGDLATQKNDTIPNEVLDLDEEIKEKEIPSNILLTPFADN